MSRVLLVEDHAAFGDAPASLLGQRPAPGLEVVVRCGSLAECRALGATSWVRSTWSCWTSPCPTGTGGELVGDLRRANPSVGVLLLTTSVEGDPAGKAEAAGAGGEAT